MNFRFILYLTLIVLKNSYGQVFLTEKYVSIYAKQNFQPFVDSTLELKEFLDAVVVGIDDTDIFLQIAEKLDT